MHGSGHVRAVRLDAIVPHKTAATAPGRKQRPGGEKCGAAQSGLSLAPLHEPLIGVENFGDSDALFPLTPTLSLGERETSSAGKVRRRKLVTACRRLCAPSFL